MFHSTFENRAFRSEAAVPVTYCSNVIGGVYLYEYDSGQAEILLGLQNNLRNITLLVCVFAVVVSVVLSRMVTSRMNHLLDQVWGYEYQGDDRTVDVHIRRLREKLEPNPAMPVYIMTKWGVGYYLRDEISETEAK